MLYISELNSLVFLYFIVDTFLKSDWETLSWFFTNIIHLLYLVCLFTKWMNNQLVSRTPLLRSNCVKIVSSSSSEKKVTQILIIFKYLDFLEAWLTKQATPYWLKLKLFSIRSKSRHCFNVSGQYYAKIKGRPKFWFSKDCTQQKQLRTQLKRQSMFTGDDNWLLHPRHLVFDSYIHWFWPHLLYNY